MRLIDADALIRIVQQSTQDAGLHFSDSQKFLRWLRKVPTIDAVPVVHARWLHEEMKDGVKDIRCSHCGEYWSVACDEDDWSFLVLDMTENELLYCPSCGARMDGEANG